MRKEHYNRHAFSVDEQLAKQYCKMRKSEILLHQYILSIADNDWAVKRNMEAASRETGCSKRWLYDAETSLVVRGLLRRTSRSRTIFWKLVPTFDEKKASAGVASEAPVPEAKESQEHVVVMSKPKQRGFLSWLRRLKE